MSFSSTMLGLQPLMPAMYLTEEFVPHHRFVAPRVDWPQQVIRRYEIVQLHAVEQGIDAAIGTPHYWAFSSPVAYHGCSLHRVTGAISISSAG